MSTICALYNLYNEDYWLPYSVASIYAGVDAIAFIVSDTAWYGPSRDQQSTLSTIEALPDPDRKISVIRGSWSSEPEQRNFSLAVAATLGADYALIIDADELYHQHDLERMRRSAEQHPSVDCWHINWVTYWKSVRYRIDPVEPYKPVVLVKLGSVGYLETRNPVGSHHELFPPSVAICHHLSYALSDERLALKHISFPGHAQTAHESWLKEKWFGWDTDPTITDLHPVDPPAFHRAVPIPKELVPRVLWELYEGKGLP